MQPFGSALRKRLQPYFGSDWLVPVFIIDSYLTCVEMKIQIPKLLTGIVGMDSVASVPPLKLMTWNVLIDDAKGMKGVSNDTGRFDRIAEVINSSGADLVCLQEVTTSSLKLLTEKCPSVNFFSSNQFEHRPYMQVIGSKFPITSQVISMDPKAGPSLAQPNGVKPLASGFKSGKGTHKHITVSIIESLSLVILNVHFSAGYNNIETRMGEVLKTMQLVESYQRAGLRHVFVVGDWNCITRMKVDAPLWTAEPRLLPGNWTELAPPVGSLTVDPATNPLSQKLSRTGMANQLDHIYYCGVLPVTSYRCDVIITKGECSDHYPLVATVTL